MLKEFRSTDGNRAVTHIAYAFSDVAAIYPITPSSDMGEEADEMSAKGVLNLFGQKLKVVEMQSEAGAAGAVHGVLASGGLSTTFTASQGLLLMIPVMFKVAGELIPTVFHVAARAVATHALSIFGDHSDVMSVRSTGWGLIASSSPQEAHDIALISHIATLKTKVPMMHFFDGFRTSHEVQKIEVLSYEEMAELVPWDEVEHFRMRGMNPEHPRMRGGAENPDIFFQAREASNSYYNAAPGIIAEVMETVGKKLGREYHLFDYYGDPKADRVIVVMGSGADVVHETVDYMMKKGEKVGVLKVRLYRPWSSEHFLAALPKTVKKLAVLDRCKEPGAPGEPLYIDILATLSEAGRNDIKVVGGRFGLSSKDFDGTSVVAVYDNLNKGMKNHFTVGINDDVTHTSLTLGEEINAAPEGTVSCKFWGFGSDGTVSANKGAIKIIGDHTDLYTQGHFVYDAFKSGGLTVSHLKFAPSQIRGHYLIHHADYIACHKPVYVQMYDMVSDLKTGGTFVLNCNWLCDDIEKNLPGSMKRALARKKANFYTVDAVGLAETLGLGGRINMIMQTVFFALAKVIPVEDAIAYLKKEIIKSYGDKGEEVIKKNNASVDEALKHLNKFDIPELWANAELETVPVLNVPKWVKEVMKPIRLQKGDQLPVSTFAVPLDGMSDWSGPDGTFPVGTTVYDKRGIAINVPEWNAETCVMCNQCSFVCPHGVIRPYLLNEEEAARAPKSFVMKDAVGEELKGLKYRMQVSVMDCTGCGNCAETDNFVVCPVNVMPGVAPAIVMKPLQTQFDEIPNQEFADTIKEKAAKFAKDTITSSQYQEPLFKYHGACGGCGETAYYKLLTQLFGDRLMIGNATGCSSIYGGSVPSFPFCTNQAGHGPAWCNSLFEDNAEFTLGIKVSMDQRRDRINLLIGQVLDTNIPADLKQAMKSWLEVSNDGEKSREAGDRMAKLLDKYAGDNKVLKQIQAMRDIFTKKSIWAIGGDGWAYDIGFGGLDHVIAMNQDLNILVLDTEVYSNTGGQASKSSPTGAVAKFASSGKKTAKKDLAAIAMCYGYVYVASIAMGYNKNQTLKAFLEAEAYPGPSLIIAYSPCINQGIKVGMEKTQYEQEVAVRSGYWPLFRYNPLRTAEGLNPFQLDSPEPDYDLHKFLMREVRYASLSKSFPEEAKVLQGRLIEEYHDRLIRYKELAEEFTPVVCE
jgi:pyruvate-ferredoxin/flavodoxin oxidoreductase